MKKNILVFLCLFLFLTLGAQDFGVGLDVFHVSPGLSSSNIYEDTKIGLSIHLFTENNYEFLFGLGWLSQGSSDRYGLSLKLGGLSHLIEKDNIDCGLGANLDGRIFFEPVDNEYSYSYNILKLTLPLFIDIKFNDNLVTRLSTDIMYVQYDTINEDLYIDSTLYQAFIELGIIYKF